MAETYGDYFTGLGRSIGQGVTFGFGDEIEAGIRALGAGTYDEEIAKIREDLEKFRKTNPVSAYGSEIAASLPTGLGLGALALRAGVRGIGKIGAAEGALYGAGVGEGAEDRAVSAAIGAPLGAAGAVVGEKVVRGIAPMIGKFMKRGSGSETRGATDIQLDAGDQPNSASFEAVVGTDSPDFLKSLFDKDDDFARDILGEVKAGPNADITDPVSPQELSRVRSQIQTATRDFLADQPDEMTVYRIGSVEGDAPTSFSLDPSFDGSTLPWAEPGSPVRQYKVRKEDVLAAPNAVFRPGKGTDDELEVIINANRVVSTDQPQATVFDVETGVTSPLEKTVGEPRTSDLGPGGINPITKDPSRTTGLFAADYSPIENALANAERVMNASPTKGLTGEQYLARLAEQPSVTKTELNASGLASFLSRPENKRRKIPVAEVQQYMKENAPDIEVFKYTGDQNNVTYRDTQRFMDRDAYSEVGYGEITINNRNAHSATLGHNLSHYRDQLGNFAHVRYSDHNDASGGVSRVIEENQFDLLQSLLKPELTSRITTIKLTPERVADYDARIEKLRATPEYPIFRQTGDDFLEATSQHKSAVEAQKEFVNKQQSITQKKRNRFTASATQIGSAGKMAAGGGGPTDDFEALIRIVTPDFLDDTVFRAIRSTKAEIQSYSPSSDEIGQIITRSINSTPEQLAEEVLEAAKKRGKDPLAEFPPGVEPRGQQRMQLASKHATPAEKAMLLASSRIQTDAVFTYKNGFESVALSPSPDMADAYLLGRMMDLVPSQDEASRIVRENMAKAMSAPRQLKVTSDILEQDSTKMADLTGEINKAVDRVDAKKKAKAKAALEFESASKKLVLRNPAITGVIDKASGADTKGFFEYAQKTNFLPREANPVDPAERARLVPNQPFDTPLQAARHNILMTIDDAITEGVDRIYFPDYRDIADIREINPEGFIKTVYKDAPEKVIKELKQKFPDLKTGRISPGEFVEDHLGEIADEADVDRPVLYLDLTPASMGVTRSAVRLGIPRRYAKGGPVDVRSGIGNMFRLYS